ncbi:probable glutathione S-transferase [Cajanus cajan]|uniref:glutathione transferase n=1 Tax=Cajanus cajan TaxID=3821 RepID=A0A151SMB8_CAJCA|nr:probable glutathione S-transferase [Cajanus cajan]KYP55976.1 putative glutathione S-transferase [Cajanus cajan]
MASEHGEEVKVLGKWSSPFSNRVVLSLKLKGVAYKYSEEDFANKSDDLLKYNPIHKKVPVLIHKGNPLPESLVIVEYIDDTWTNNPLLPQDPYERALARFWSKTLDDKILPALWNACWSDEKGRDKAVEEALEALKILQEALKDKRFFGGETIGLVDIAANFIGYWVAILQEIAGLELLTIEKFPKLYKWSQEFVNHPVIKESLPPRDKLFAFFKASASK